MVAYNMTVTVLCMIYRGDEILLQDRVASTWPGVTFPGGHVHPGEPFMEAIKREMLEETGYTIEHPVICGIKQYLPHDNECILSLLYKTDTFYGELSSSREGTMTWVPRSKLHEYDLVPDFAQLLHVFDSPDYQELIYRYDAGEERFVIELH